VYFNLFFLKKKDQEFRRLYSYILTGISKLLGKYEKSKEKTWTKKDANWYQSLLITMLHFVIGGQRRQIVLQMTIEVNRNFFFYLLIFKIGFF
jgi:hypothetical protein